jgi:hypothetical protein
MRSPSGCLSQPADAREAHGDAGSVPRRALQPLERHFEYQTAVGSVHHFLTEPNRLTVFYFIGT